MNFFRQYQARQREKEIGTLNGRPGIHRKTLCSPLSLAGETTPASGPRASGAAEAAADSQGLFLSGDIIKVRVYVRDDTFRRPCRYHSAFCEEGKTETNK